MMPNQEKSVAKSAFKRKSFLKRKEEKRGEKGGDGDEKVNGTGPRGRGPEGGLPASPCLPGFSVTCPGNASFLLCQETMEVDVMSDTGRSSRPLPSGHRYANLETVKEAH